CPKCQTERSLDEFFCEGEVDGHACDWDLSQEPVRPSGWRPSAPTPLGPADSPPTSRICPNGHEAAPGDLICGICGTDLEAAQTSPPADEGTNVGEGPGTESGPNATMIAGWRLEQRLTSTSLVRERFIAVSQETGREALLTLYADGHEPDPQVYDVLRS